MDTRIELVLKDRFGTERSIRLTEPSASLIAWAYSAMLIRRTTVVAEYPVTTETCVVDHTGRRNWSNFIATV